jgi:hypothetical protein
MLVSNCVSSQTFGAYGSLQSFVDSCPQNDRNSSVIRRDFQILRDGKPVGDVTCREPYSTLPVAQVTDELATIQALRFAYYMDLGRSKYLPWTPLRLYDWLQSRLAGFNIDTSLKDEVAASCCVTINGRRYITEATIPDDMNRRYRQTLAGLAAQVALIAHETRHTDGYRHVSCCGTQGACDQSYDEKNLSPFGIQYYLAKQWLTGAIDLGYSCDPKMRVKLGNAFLELVNVFPANFCDAKPPVLSIPQAPGGVCTK